MRNRKFREGRWQGLHGSEEYETYQDGSTIRRESRNFVYGIDMLKTQTPNRGELGVCGLYSLTNTEVIWTSYRQASEVYAMLNFIEHDLIRVNLQI